MTFPVPQIAPSLEPSVQQPGRQSALLAYLAVFCAAVLAYIPTLSYGFVHDDDVQVAAMPLLKSWHMLPGYFAHPIPGFSAHYYRPLFFLWLDMNRHVWGPRAWGWHLSGVLLHAAAALLALAVLRRYFTDIRWAGIAALVFAVHPAHVETVAWISGGTDTLMSVGLLGSLFLWMKARESSPAWRPGAALICGGLAVLAKETAVVLPLIIFLHVLMGIPRTEIGSGKLRGRLAAALRQSVPYLLVAAACLLLRRQVLRGVPPTAQSISLRDGLLTIPSLMVFYVKHLIWPSRLSLNYDLPIVTSAQAWAFWAPLALLGIAAVAGCLCVLRRREIRAVAAANWFLLPLLPVLYLPLFSDDDFVHDRYLYLSVLAFSIVTGLLAEYFGKPEMQKKTGIVPIAVLSAAVVSLALGTVVQARPWKNNLSLYTNAVRIAPKNMLARNNLAREYAFEGYYSEAAEMFREILVVRPTMWLANYNYGFVNYRLGNFALAERYLLEAIRINPNDPDEHICLGTTYLKQGRLAEAERQVRTGIVRKPTGSGYHLALAFVFLAQGNPEGAQEELQQELLYHPENAGAVARVRAANPQLDNTDR
jgi:Tfp pilus assembly protein PilF